MAAIGKKQTLLIARFSQNQTKANHTAKTIFLS
jgi:hypothetical protein